MQVQWARESSTRQNEEIAAYEICVFGDEGCFVKMMMRYSIIGGVLYMVSRITDSSTLLRGNVTSGVFEVDRLPENASTGRPSDLSLRNIEDNMRERIAHKVGFTANSTSTDKHEVYRDRIRNNPPLTKTAYNTVGPMYLSGMSASQGHKHIATVQRYYRQDKFFLDSMTLTGLDNNGNTRGSSISRHFNLDTNDNFE